MRGQYLSISPPVLGVDLVEVLGEEPVLLKVADAHQVGLVAVVVSVALEDYSTVQVYRRTGYYSPGKSPERGPSASADFC